jgi:UDP-N-acetylglucosamine--N-acetylmuramyl-(pentapeptide) pyrophosphoryl-undecaprenol N-acetylglucosamine transferase
VSTLLVSSVGGHLTELHQLLPRLQGIDARRTWVTFETPQSRSLLEGEDVIYVDYTGPRDLRNVLAHVRVAQRMFKRGHSFSTVVSTGSGIALSFLPLARMRGAECHYIESATRSLGPSTTGRLLRAVPGIRLYTQYEGWAQGPWAYAGSVLDRFAPGPRCGGKPIRRAVVTLGTMEDYEFRRLIERALQIIPPEAEVLWQVGCTEVADLPIRGHSQLPAHELREAIETADVVIAHAGCGSSVGALAAGKLPVLVARRKRYGENVDDHQMEIAQELSRRELAVVRSIEDLDGAALALAARSSVTTSAEPAAFQLGR